MPRRGSSSPGRGAKWPRRCTPGVALFGRSTGAHMGPGLLSARRHGRTLGNSSDLHPCTPNRTRRVPRGRRAWPPGPCLCPSSSRRGRPFSPPGWVEPHPTRIHSLFLCVIGLVRLCSTCGAQGLFVTLPPVQDCCFPSWARMHLASFPNVAQRRTVPAVPTGGRHEHMFQSVSLILGKWRRQGS